MSDKIIIVGYMQALKRMDGFDLPRQGVALEDEQLQRLPHHYLVCDSKGFIHNLSEGLWHEVGLSHKFFQYDGKMSQRIHIEDIMETTLNSFDFQDAIRQEAGLDCQIDTSEIFDLINIEDLTAEELQMSKSKIGLYNCNLRLIRVEYASWCIVDYYRVVLYPKNFKTGLNARLEFGLAALIENIQGQKLDSSLDEVMQLQPDSLGLSSSDESSNELKSKGSESKSQV